MKGKLNNKGFSLIEVLVGVAILAIILVPILQNFSKAANINAKSKQMQKATTIAQNVMEGLKMYNTENTSRTFNKDTNVEFNILKAGGASVYTVDSYGEKNLSGDILKNDSTLGATDAASTLKNGTEFIFNEWTSGKYYYFMNGVTDGAAKYDVNIKVDSTVYNTFNSTQLPEIVDLNGETTVVLDPTSSTDLAVKTFSERSFSRLSDPSCPSGARGYIETDLKPYVKMQVELTLDNVAGEPTGSLKTHVKAKAIYTLQNNINISGCQGIDNNVEVMLADQVYSAIDNIYIMYKANVLSAVDTFRIDSNNAAKNEIKLFVVEQVADGVTESGSFNYEILNDSYAGTERIKLFTNCPTAHNLTLGSDHPKNNQIVQKGEAKKRLYSLEVTVLKAGTGDVLATLTSSREE